MLLLWLVALNLILEVQSVCFPPFGCFETDSDFFNPLLRPINLDPDRPEEIQVKFFIYSKWIRSYDQCPGRLFDQPNDDSDPYTWRPCLIETEDILNRNVLRKKLKSISKVRENSSDSNKPMGWTAFIIHGWISSLNNSQYMFDIKNRLLRNQARPYDMVILVDWNKGANTLYTKACANARLVGAEIAYFIQNLVKNVKGVDLKRIHLIGHSLGAHVAGYAGANFTENEQIQRITPLDPAGPFFNSLPEKVRVDRTDAKFVDVIHSSGFYLSEPGLGMKDPTGHIDFYPNGGDEQPGCQGTLTRLLNSTHCNHARATTYFINSIPDPKRPKKTCQYKSAKCLNWADFEKDQCIAKRQCRLNICGGQLLKPPFSCRIKKFANAQNNQNSNKKHGDEEEEEDEDKSSPLAKTKQCAQMGFFAYRWAEMMGEDRLRRLRNPVEMYLNTTGVAPFC